VFKQRKLSLPIFDNRYTAENPWSKFPCLFQAAVILEIGLITPPLRVNVYVIKTVAQDVPLGKIFLGCMPFVLGMLGFISVIAVFPEIVLSLVR
jgi:TRAP-type C4-dicarboxylate transport system permease large subunit